MTSSFALYVDAEFTSPYAMSAYVALIEKKRPFTVCLVNLDAEKARTPDFLQHSLTTRVPTLVHGTFALTESSAITEYLEQCYPPPAHQALYPQAIHDLARARQVQAWLRSDLHALRNERPSTVVFSGATGNALSATGRADAAKLIGIASTLLKPGQPCLFNDWSIVDIELAMMLRRLWHETLLPDTLRQYADTQWQRPALAQWLTRSTRVQV